MTWLTEATVEQKRALLAASLGWMLDSMDVMLYSMVLAHLMRDFKMTEGAAGLMASLTLASSAVGGAIFGILADRVGRSRALMASILVYSVFTAACGMAGNMIQLAVYRVLLGLGMGGEWACGAALVAETWPSRHRGKALGVMQSAWAIGYGLAAAITALLLPRFGWRAVFFAGVAPALITFWIRGYVPEPEPHDEQGEFEVRVKRDDRYTRLLYRWHPLDVVGWKGDLCPMRLNKRDFRPVVSPRYHVPPSVHAVWKSDGFEIGLFAPRPTETGDPTALRVPFFHSNIDKDEVLFYHQGQFFSRAGIGEAYITHHPQGLQHGPQAAAIEASKTKEFADEYAVMVEADRPFEQEEPLATVEVEGYATSWARGLGLLD